MNHVSDFTEVRADLFAARALLKQYQPEVSDSEPLRCLMQASYEFNRGCNLTASRHETGTPVDYYTDVISNFDQVVIGTISFSPPVPPEIEQEVIFAAREILHSVRTIVKQEP